MRYFLRIAYDGTNFHGWQRQPNAISVQETIEDALSLIMRENVSIVGAGRTDTGVHATEMYAHFDGPEFIDRLRLLGSLNRLIGKEISITGIKEVVQEAHARFDALSRRYKYCISIGKDPFYSRFSHEMQRLPDVELMNKAANILLQTEDFTSFAKLHSDAKTNLCKVTEAVWHFDKSGEKLFFTITANRFLRNMVRAVVGTLLEVGTKKISIEQFKEIINKKDRCEAGMSMPAKGLFLTKIVYPKEIFIL